MGALDECRLGDLCPALLFLVMMIPGSKRGSGDLGHMTGQVVLARTGSDQ